MSETLFPTIGNAATATDSEERQTQEIESLCMSCGEQGVTRLLLTSIPFFQEVVLMSFRCTHCGTQNNEIQSAGEVRPEGTKYTVKVFTESDLDRTIVRSQSCELGLPAIELTLPASGRGQLTTVEGLLRDVYTDLKGDQVLRRIQAPEAYEKIEGILKWLVAIVGDTTEDPEAEAVEKTERIFPPFTLLLDDPAGNSFVEFIGEEGGKADSNWSLQTYPRTMEQNIALGLAQATETEEEQPVKFEDPNDEVFEFPGASCPNCTKSLDTRMKRVNIPYFKEILLMSTSCTSCGYRDNEVKSGSAVSDKGKKITLKVEAGEDGVEDLARDILKSDTAALSIPELGLTLQHGTLGGRFTTVEGLLNQIFEELGTRLRIASSGDSETETEREGKADFLKGLADVKSASRSFTLILDDPMANSYVQNPYAPDPDPNMTIETYDRTWEQNEDLGLNDIKVEGYEEDAGETETNESTKI